MVSVNKVGYGEYLFLADAPIYKRRYTVNGDIVLGCTIGCEFCIYRMIDTTIPYLGTGELKRLVTPEEYAESIANSRLVSERSLVIMGARGDASMYPNDIPKMLDTAEKLGVTAKFLALRRAIFDKTVKDQLADYPQLFYGTTITPKAIQTGSPVPDYLQLKGLKNVTDFIDRVSIEVGPVTPNNIDAVKDILKELKNMGWENVMYRGVTVGSWGVERKEAVEKMIKLGFITQEQAKQALESKEYFYAIKNNLDALMEKAIQNMFEEVGLKSYRYAGQFYADNWDLPVAFTRRNKLRLDIIPYTRKTHYPNKDLKQQLEYLGYYDYEVKWSNENGVRIAYVDTKIPITEDVEMYLGEVTGVAVIATNYLHSPDGEMLKHYLKYSFLGIPERTKKKIIEKLGVQNLTQDT